MKQEWFTKLYTVALVSLGMVTAALYSCADVQDTQQDIPLPITMESEDFSLTPAAMALLVDGGEKRLNAYLADELSGRVTIEWSVENPAIAAISGKGGSVVVLPNAAGSTVVKAKLIPSLYGFTIDEKLAEVSCPVIVLADFTVDKNRILLVNGGETQTITASLPEEVIDFVKIEWTLETSVDGSLIIVSETDNSIEIQAVAGEPLGVITAKLKAKDAAAFNGTGLKAICAVTAIDTMDIHIADQTYMLPPPSSAAKTVIITAAYAPAQLDMYDPQMSWESADEEIIQMIEAGSASVGRASARFEVKAAGETQITAHLTVFGNTTHQSAQIEVVEYIPPEFPVISLALDSRPASVFTAEFTETITATVLSNGGNAASDPRIEWEFSDVNAACIIVDAGDDGNNHVVKILGTWAGEEAAEVTVTARSVSNPDIFESFTITVNPFRVMVRSLEVDARTTLSAENVVNIGATVSSGLAIPVVWSTDRPDLVDLTPLSGADERVRVQVKAGALVQGLCTIEITATSVADYVTSGSITLSITPHNFVIRYHKNDGTNGLITGGPYAYGSGQQTLISIAELGWTRDGSTFAGWATSASGPLVYRDEALISALNDNEIAMTVGGTVDLCAKWTLNLSNEDLEDFGDATESLYSFTVNNQNDWNTALELVMLGGTGAYIINIGSDFDCTVTRNNYTFSAGDLSTKTVSIRGAGRTITVYPSGVPENRGSFLNLETGQHLILRDITFRGSSGIAADAGNYPFIRVNSDATLEMKDGSVLEAFKSEHQEWGSGYLAPVNVLVGGSFIMSGGAEIRNCKGFKGGGVFSDGLFVMNGVAAVSGCEANYAGGGVYIGNGSFTMNNNAIISNCRKNGSPGFQYGGGGGGVLVYTGSFTMNDSAAISGCVSATGGGGVALYGATSPASFYMNDTAVISGNRTEGAFGLRSGGGVLATATSNANSRFNNIIKTGGIIYGRNASSDLANTTPSPAAGGDAISVGTEIDTARIVRNDTLFANDNFTLIMNQVQ